MMTENTVTSEFQSQTLRAPALLMTPLVTVCKVINSMGPTAGDIEVRFWTERRSERRSGACLGRARPRKPRYWVWTRSSRADEQRSMRTLGPKASVA